MKKTVIGMIVLVMFCCFMQSCTKYAKTSSENKNASIATSTSQVIGVPSLVEGDYYGNVREKEIHNYSDPAWYLFKNDRYEFEAIVIPDGGVEKGTFALDRKDRLLYVNFQSDKGTPVRQRLGVLFFPNRRLFLYENTGVWFEPEEGYNWEGFTPSIQSIHTSSYLTEKIYHMTVKHLYVKRV